MWRPGLRSVASSGGVAGVLPPSDQSLQSACTAGSLALASHGSISVCAGADWCKIASQRAVYWPDPIVAACRQALCMTSS